jgi:hypothetical protein
VQSTAALVLAAQGVIDFPLFLFANVGDDSERPETLAFVAEVARPFAAAHGIALVEVSASETLFARTLRNRRSVPIPVRMSGSGAIGTRQCTQRFKIAPVAAELRRRGATIAEPATLGLGISVDEWSRMRNSAPVAYEILAYPLIDLRLDRQACRAVIAQAGLPVPPKSSCTFCPFHTMAEWRDLHRRDPARFAQACELEQAKNADRAAMGRDAVWLSPALKPLREAVEDGQLPLWPDDAGCDVAGYCHV